MVNPPKIIVVITKGKNNSEFADSPTVFAYSKLDADRSWDSDYTIIGIDAGSDSRDSSICVDCIFADSSITKFSAESITGIVLFWNWDKDKNLERPVAIPNSATL